MGGRDLKALVFAAAMAAVFSAASARAAECGTGAEGFDDWLKSFKQVAINNGISREVVDSVRGGVAYDPSVKAHDHGVAAFGRNFASFAAILQWNRAPIYAKTVALFADRLAGR